jgi:hypothetical protein
VVTVWHLRDVSSGARRRLKNKEIDIAEVPYFEGLTIKTMLQFATQWNNGLILSYFPVAEMETL